MKTVHVQYYAMLREGAGKDQETIQTQAVSLRELFEEIAVRYSFSIPITSLKVAVNDEIRVWESPLNDGDTISLIPPVSGG